MAKDFNPFLNRKGELVNKFLNYQKVLDNPNVSQKAKAYISQATGLKPRIPSMETETEQQNVVSTTPTTPFVAQQYQWTRMPSSSGNKLVDTAKQYLGTQYVWGGTTPKGFDCSGLMQYTFKQNGISIPRTAREQFKAGTAVSSANLQPGDLVFFKGSNGSATEPGHVGMYVGNGQYIHAPKTGDVVKISNLSSRKDYVGARKYG